MSAPSPQNSPKGPLSGEVLECEKCYGLAHKFSGATGVTCYGLERKIKVPKEAEKDLIALEPLAPNTHVFIIGLSAYNAEMCKSGRPPLLLNGVYISHVSQEVSVPTDKQRQQQQQQQKPRTQTPPTLDDVHATYDKLCKVVPEQAELLTKAVKTTVADFEELYPELKKAAGKTAKELPGKFVIGAKVTLDSFGSVLGDMVDYWTSPPKK